MQLTRFSPGAILGLEVAEELRNLRRDVEVADGEIEDRLARQWSFPTHTYHEPRVYEFELEAIFSRRWQYFAPVEKLCVPGDVVIGTIGEIPIVVTRGEDELLHGFVNICRHRGERVDAWIGLWNQTFEEDREAAEIQQKGLRTGRLPWMRYVGAREEPKTVLFFNGLIWDAYKDALGI